MLKSIRKSFVLVAVGTAVALAGTAPAHAIEAKLDPELRSKARTAIAEGLHYLRGVQAEDGSWKKSVGITALAVRAFMESYRGYNESDGAFITRPIAYMLANIQPDGAISESNLNKAYNTATAMFALAGTKNAKYQDAITGAQKFLSVLQIDEGDGYTRDHRYYGGIGYGNQERPDLSNQYLALEGLRATAFNPKDPVWERAILFVTRCQNRTESNDTPGIANDGGFTYRPGQSSWTNGSESYGAMTNAGLISLIFAGVDKSDPRIQAAWKWIAANYTVDEHPGVAGRHTLFYYYEAFAKAMTAMGEPIIKDASGVEHNWRNDLVAKIIELQRKDGSWINPYSTREWEGIPELITARGIIALNLALRE